MRTAAIHGDGVWVSGSQKEPGGEWTVAYQLSLAEIDEYEYTAEAMLDTLSAHRQQLEAAALWIEEHKPGPELFAALEAKAESRKQLISDGVAAEIRATYSTALDRMLATRNQLITQAVDQLADTLYVKSEPAPAEFSYVNLIKTIQRVKKAAGLDPTNRWKLVIESKQMMYDIYPEMTSRIDDPPIPFAPGYIGSIMAGMDVVVDPSIEGFEFRDRLTNQPVPFTVNEDGSRTYYLFDPELLELPALPSTWGRTMYRGEVMNDGSSSEEG